MLSPSGYDFVFRVSHRSASVAARCVGHAMLCTLVLTFACKVHAQTSANPEGAKPAKAEPTQCLPTGDGYLKARLSGSIEAELNWGNRGTDCTGAVRPTDGGVRMRFSRITATGRDKGIALVIGIAKLTEGATARAV